jgi:hypothetical protein
VRPAWRIVGHDFRTFGDTLQVLFGGLSPVRVQCARAMAHALGKPTRFDSPDNSFFLADINFDRSRTTDDDAASRSFRRSFPATLRLILEKSYNLIAIAAASLNAADVIGHLLAYAPLPIRLAIIAALGGLPERGADYRTTQHQA